ncbi:hypothetical protein WJX81_004604 [Elliptochloris bilobata]|uniref:Uncharacterized protein n=1 Tax=Elliptochloris bilobata TaxID=381761 RepID=A0AAW1RZ47_9CHLO
MALVWVITGASRGLGLGMVAALLEQEGTIVVAAARNPDKAEALQKLAERYSGRVHTVVLDTSDEASVKAAAATVEKHFSDGVDFLINMAGVADSNFVSALQTEGSEYLRVLKVNTVGSFLVTQAFYPLLKKGNTRTVVNVSSRGGSITNHRAGGPISGKIVAYTSSKAALNMQTAVLAGALKDDGFIVVSTCPGWVDTDMGTRSDFDMPGIKPDLTVEESTKRHLALIAKLTKDDSGKYFSAANDKEIPY